MFVVGAAAILLVTANEGRRLVIARLLRCAGFHVDLACSPREALHALVAAGRFGEPGPSLVMVDQESLGPGAEHVIRAVHNAELAIPIIVLSSFGAADDTIGCLRAGATDYVSLPAQTHELMEVLQRVLTATTIR